MLRPRLELRFGITGHRPPRLAAAQFARVERQIGEVLAQAIGVLGSIRHDHAAVFADEDACAVLLSPLATGADRLAARAALAHGAVLEATLPFRTSIYSQDFDPAEAAEVRDLFASARRALMLPGEADDRETAYHAMGAVNAAQCDILLAVWDGEASRGMGGTAGVVADAVASGLPVVMIDADREVPALLLWNSSDTDPHDAPTLDTVARQQASLVLPSLIVARW